MSDCRHALDLLEGYVDREVPEEDRRVIERHLADCVDCTDREDFLRKLRALVRRACGSDALPPGLEERLRRAIAAVELDP